MWVLQRALLTVSAVPKQKLQLKLRCVGNSLPCTWSRTRQVPSLFQHPSILTKARTSSVSASSLALADKFLGTYSPVSELEPKIQVLPLRSCSSSIDSDTTTNTNNEDGIEVLQPNDVVCKYGSGSYARYHVGNRNFLTIVAEHKAAYLKLSKRKEKTELIRTVVQKVRNQSPPARFLKQDPITNKWYDIGDKEAHIKVSAALRWENAMVQEQQILNKEGKDGRENSVEDNDNNKQMEIDATLWDKKWKKKLESLKSFVEEHGHAQVPFRYGRDPTLGLWVQYQRQAYRKKLEGLPTALNSKQQEELDALGVMWNVHEELWDQHFKEYVEFSSNHGHLNLGIAPPALANWCSRQRTIYQKFVSGDTETESHAYAMTNERIEKLNGIGFPWDVNEAIWEAKWEELRAYYQLYGTCNVSPVDDYTLYRWVGFQRQQYRKMAKNITRNNENDEGCPKQTPNGDSDDDKSEMTHQRVEKLNKIGFIWDPRDYNWDTKFHELLQFISTTPGKMPSPPLGRWLEYQKHLLYRKLDGDDNVSLTDDRIERLRSIGAFYLKRRR